MARGLLLLSIPAQLAIPQHYASETAPLPKLSWQALGSLWDSPALPKSRLCPDAEQAPAPVLGELIDDCFSLVRADRFIRLARLGGRIGGKQ